MTLFLISLNVLLNVMILITNIASETLWCETDFSSINDWTSDGGLRSSTKNGCQENGYNQCGHLDPNYGDYMQRDTDASRYINIKIIFTAFIAGDFENGEGFYVDCRCGGNWRGLLAFAYIGLSDSKFTGYELPLPSECNLYNNVRIRFRFIADDEDMYFNDVCLTGDLTSSPTNNPSVSTTIDPTMRPSESPTIDPSKAPTIFPTNVPSNIPTETPSDMPSLMPTNVPTIYPSSIPTISPSITPTDIPTDIPTINPVIGSIDPTISPTMNPSMNPSIFPTIYPTIIPSDIPTNVPTIFKVETTETASISPSISTSVSLNDFQNESMNPVILIIILLLVMIVICIIVGIYKYRTMKQKIKQLNEYHNRHNTIIDDDRTNSNIKIVPLKTDDIINTNDNNGHSNFNMDGIVYNGSLSPSKVLLTHNDQLKALEIAYDEVEINKATKNGDPNDSININSMDNIDYIRTSETKSPLVDNDQLKALEIAYDEVEMKTLTKSGDIRIQKDKYGYNMTKGINNNNDILMNTDEHKAINEAYNHVNNILNNEGTSNDINVETLK